MKESPLSDVIKNSEGITTPWLNIRKYTERPRFLHHTINPHECSANMKESRIFDVTEKSYEITANPKKNIIA